MVELWKTLFAVASFSPNATERLFHSTSLIPNYEPYSAKRKLASTLVRYLYAAWTHADVYTLPPGDPLPTLY